MLHVVCVNAANYQGRGVEYTNVLFDMVRRNLPEGFAGDFTVFTDDPSGDYLTGIKIRDLPAPWLKGWWHKMSLFQRGLFPKGERILFFDLDTVIVGPLDDVVKYSGSFGTLSDFYRPKRLGSAIMAWAADSHTNIWESYCEAGCPQDDPYGDQGAIEKRLGRYDILQDLYPNQILSFKASDSRFGIPKGSRIICCHGRPKPHEAPVHWMRQVWKVGGGTSAEFVYVTNVSRETIEANIKAAMGRNANWLQMHDQQEAMTVLVCAGGPSLGADLPSIRAHVASGAYVFAVNGTYKYLWENHIFPNAHIVCDARPENIDFVPDLSHFCERLYSSQCDPQVLDAAGSDLTLWHPFFDGVLDITGHVPNGCYVGGGTTAGLKAVAIAYGRGSRKIHLYGFDSCYKGRENHAYPQPLNDGERIVDVELENGDKFRCASWMVTQAEDFQNLATELTAQGCELFVHGEGLIPALAALAQVSTESAEIRAKEILRRLEGVKAPVVAEIGIFTGELSKRLLGRRNDLKLFMIDSWGGNKKPEFEATNDYHAGLTQDEQDACRETATVMTSFARDRAVIIPKLSVEAANDIEDESLDLAFIDADHSYEGCWGDIQAYWPKIKPGGILAGHDYANNRNDCMFGPMVKRAVDEFTTAKGLDLDLGDNYTWFAVKPGSAVA